MYGVGHLVARYRARDAIRVTVVVAEAVVTRHRNEKIIKHSARVSVKEEAVHLRTVSGLNAGGVIARGAGNAHYGNRLFGICRVNYVKVLIEVNGGAVGIYAVGDGFGYGVLYLGVLTVGVYRSVCVIPYGRGAVACLRESLFALTVRAHPLYELLRLTAAKVVVPVLNDLFKSTVGAVLISLPENVVKAYVIARRHNEVIVIGA